MRILILLAMVLAIAGILWFTTRNSTGPVAAPPEPEPEPQPEPEADTDPAPDSPLEVELREALAVFETARNDADQAENPVRIALASLVDETRELETRVAGDEAFSRRVRQPVRRLLLPLYAVTRRSARISHRAMGEDREALLSGCAEAIGRAADQLGRISDKADEAALLRLEADLEVLQSRLDRVE